jgi:predicted O-linked N-acetylglucosamine transferase (SPINDLY family)
MPTRPFRIGFISRFFYDHTIGKLHAGLIQKLSREHFRVVVFRFSSIEDPWARRIDEAADEVVVLPTHLEAAREEIARQRLDLLYYTDIGMETVTYFLAFSRLAGVQCTGWGHPLTTGIPTIDYFISSDLLEPAGAEKHYSERLVRLETLPTYYFRPELTGPVRSRADFGFRDDEHIYLCPQSLFKLHPDFDRLLGAILEADARGRLVLIEGQQPNFAKLLDERFQRSLPAQRERIQFLPRQSTDNFLHLLAAADVILDPPQFSGGNTSLEALALGIPIVTLPGAFMRTRVTYGCYRQMDITDCIASDEDDYVRIAVRLGTDKQYRARLREAILAGRIALFENQKTIRAYDRFFLRALGAIDTDT